MKLVKIVDYRRTYVSKVDGKEHPSATIYAVVSINDREHYIAIKPRFADSSRDWAILESACELIVRKAKDN